MLKNTINKLSEKYFKEIVGIRQYIHKHPELSFKEFNTSKYICGVLDDYGIHYKAGYVKTGIVAKIEGKNPDKRIIGLRADMDALPIKEENDIGYKSCNEGVMHACGHDIHSASLLGAAKILHSLKDKFEGSVILFFQPGEESFPGGAKLMIEEGVLEEFKPELMIAQHVFPELPVGQVGFKEGMYMASGDEIFLTIKGKGGHAALPHLCTDTVLIASHIVVALQQIVSRKAQAGIPTVLSFGKVVADGAMNIIPNEVKISGTFRTMNEEWRAEAKKEIKKIASTIAEAMGGVCEVKINDGYPFLVNDTGVTGKAKIFSKEYLGNDKVKDLNIRMTCEDFAYFSQQLPATLFRLGVRGENKTGGLHSSTFNVDERCIKVSIGTLAYLAVSFLAAKG